MFFSVLAYLHHRVVIANPVESESKSQPPVLAVGMAVGFFAVLGLLLVLFFGNIEPMWANLKLIEAMQSKGGIPASLESFKQSIALDIFGIPETREQLIQFAAQLATVNTVDLSIRQSFADYARIQMEAQIAKVPGDARYHVIMSAFMKRIGQNDAGLRGFLLLRRLKEDVIRKWFEH